MRATILGLLVFVVTMGCAITYQSPLYDEHLWALARSHGYEQVFHTHIRGKGMCAVVLISGTGTSQLSAEFNARRRGSKFFNPSIGNIIINTHPVSVVRKEVFKKKDGYWRTDIIVASPLH